MSTGDCFSYYYTSKGCQVTNCKFRHDPASKGSEDLCQSWSASGECSVLGCKYRHMKPEEVQAWRKQAARKQKANDLFKSGDFASALKYYSKAIRRYPWDAKVFFNRAACYSKLKAFDLALIDCDKAIELEPTYVKAYLGKAVVYKEMGKTSKAWRMYSRVLQMDPACAEAVEGCDECSDSQRTAEKPYQQELQQKAVVKDDDQLQQLTVEENNYVTDYNATPSDSSNDVPGNCLNDARPIQHHEQPKVAQEEATKQLQQSTPEAPIAASVLKADAATTFPGFHCRLCDVRCTSITVFSSHMTGKKHQANLKGSPQPRPTIQKLPASFKTEVKSLANKKPSPKLQQKVIMKETKVPEAKPADKAKATHQADIKNHPVPAPRTNLTGQVPPFQTLPSTHLAPFPTSPGLSNRRPSNSPSPPPPYTQTDNTTRPAKPLGLFAQANARERLPLTNVGIFWDIENCPLTRGMSVAAFVKKVRTNFLRDSSKRESQFLAVLNTSLPHNLKTAKALQEVGVCVEPCLQSAKRNSADEILRQRMRAFVDLQDDGKCSLLLISGDVDFAPDLHNFKHIRKHEVLLMHNYQAKETLKSLADKCFFFPGFIKDLPVDNEAIPTAGQYWKGNNNNNTRMVRSGSKSSLVMQDNVLILWDLKTCPPTSDSSAIEIVAKLRDTLFGNERKAREVGFAATGLHEFNETLTELGLEVGGSKQPDEMLSQMLTSLTLAGKQQAWSNIDKKLTLLVLISDDVNLIGEIRRLRYEEKAAVILIHSSRAKETLRSTVGQACCWRMEEFAEEAGEGAWERVGKEGGTRSKAEAGDGVKQWQRRVLQVLER